MRWAGGGLVFLVDTTIILQFLTPAACTDMVDSMELECGVTTTAMGKEPGKFSAPENFSIIPHSTRTV